MIFKETKLKGAYVIDIEKLEDKRGFFGRSWCKKEFEEHGINANIVQANVSYNKHRGTLRGMHFQVAPFLESKVIRCTTGAIYDVIVDLRTNSKTYLEWLGIKLTAQNFQMLFVPEGFAHGFITLKDHTSVHYMVTEYYTPGAEAGIKYDDPEIKIIWPIEPTIISDKDNAHPRYVPSTKNNNVMQLL